MNGWVWVAAILLVLGVAVVLTRTCPSVLRLLLRVQIVYCLLAYVVRPAVVMWVNPKPNYGDSLADPRLAFEGYSRGYSHVLPLAFAGTTLFFSIALAVGLTLRRIPAHDRLSSAHESAGLDVALPFYLICWFARIVGISVVRTSWMLTIADFGSVGAALVLLEYDRVLAAPRRRVMFIIIPALEILWAVLEKSKTPALAVVLALFLVSARNQSRLQIRRVIALGLVAIGLFLGVQGLKTAGQHRSTVVSASSAYPAVLRPVLPVLDRFDLSMSVTDAYFAGPHDWIGLGTYLQRAARSLVPQELSGDKLMTSGELWNTEIRSRSMPAVPGVSLADGYVAEGYVLAGWLGILLESGIFAVASVVVARSISRMRLPFSATALYVLLDASLLERGILGLVESLSKGVQLAIILAIVGVLGRTVRVSGRMRSTSGASRAASLPSVPTPT